MTPEISELADRAWKLATAPTIAPSSVYANTLRECAEMLRRSSERKASPSSQSPVIAMADAATTAHILRLEQALHSISRNTCCCRCQEAASVARAALASYVGLATEQDDLKSNPFIPGTDLSEAYEAGWRDAMRASVSGSTEGDK